MNFKKDIHYSQHLEEAILGACLLEKEAFGRIYGNLETETFYFSGHQEVFSAMKKMYKEGLLIDILTVVDFIMRIRRIELLQSTNVPYFVCRLTNAVVGTTHLEYHAHIIKTMWMDREIITLTYGGVRDGTTSEKMRSIQDKLLTLQQKGTEHDWEDMSQLMVGMYQYQEEMKKTGGIGIPTGIKMIDKENGGFHNGQMIVIGSRPSVGKSAFIGEIAINMAKKDFKVGIVSLEMSNNEVAARLAAVDTDTDFNVLYRGLYRDTQEAHDLYRKIGDRTAQLPIYVTSKTSVDIVEIRAKAAKLKALHGLDCLMVDYLQLVGVENTRNTNRENEIAKISRGAKIMAKELNIPVIMLCQLNREVTKRKGEERYPQLSDLRESGSLEQDADVVMFIHRDWMAGYQQNEQGNTTEFEADLVVRKWRNGRTNFKIPFDFHPTKMKFTERNVSGFVPVVKSFYEKDDKDPF